MIRMPPPPVPPLHGEPDRGCWWGLVCGSSSNGSELPCKRSISTLILDCPVDLCVLEKFLVHILKFLSPQLSSKGKSPLDLVELLAHSRSSINVCLRMGQQ